MARVLHVAERRSCQSPQCRAVCLDSAAVIAHDRGMPYDDERPTQPVPIDPRAAWRAAAERNALRRASAVQHRESARLLDPMAQDAESERPTVRPSAA
jgi:hypothetical protein